MSRVGAVTLTASVEREAADMITTMVREAHRRDPTYQRVWICLVDGNVHQIERVTAEARHLRSKITIIVDFVPVAAVEFDNLSLVCCVTWGMSQRKTFPGLPCGHRAESPDEVLGWRVGV